ncbi:MAG: zinc ribbon domain-containing protein [bacterium]|nr:zinc ribbon domain-containing protein [bacterium]
MNNNEMEHLLENVCRQEVEAPEQLVAYTKLQIKQSPFLNLVISISLFLNALITVFLLAVLFLPGPGWLEKMGWYFGSTTFFNGVIIYILVRHSSKHKCLNCGKGIEKEFTVCPYCAQKQELECENCNKPVARDWILCPHCGHNLCEPKESA